MNLSIAHVFVSPKMLNEQIFWSLEFVTLMGNFSLHFSLKKHENKISINFLISWVISSPEVGSLTDFNEILRHLQIVSVFRKNDYEFIITKDLIKLWTKTGTKSTGIYGRCFRCAIHKNESSIDLQDFGKCHSGIS